MLNVWSLSMVALNLRVFNDDRVLPHQPPDTAMTDIYPNLFQPLRQPSHRWTRPAPPAIARLIRISRASSRRSATALSPDLPDTGQQAVQDVAALDSAPKANASRMGQPASTCKSPCPVRDDRQQSWSWLQRAGEPRQASSRRSRAALRTWSRQAEILLRIAFAGW